MANIQLQALVMHVRAYRETSAMIRFFTREQGRLTGVLRGYRGRSRRLRVEPFCIGQLSASGRGSLLNVHAFETRHDPGLHGDALAAGFYVLELLSRALGEYQAEPSIYDASVAVLDALSGPGRAGAHLRGYELTLLNQLGYGLDFECEAGSHVPIHAEGFYRLVAQSGFVKAAGDDPEGLPGWVLQAMGQGDFSDSVVLRAARRVNQQALVPLIGGQPLTSRALLPGRS